MDIQNKNSNNFLIAVLIIILALILIFVYLIWSEINNKNIGKNKIQNFKDQTSHSQTIKEYKPGDKIITDENAYINSIKINKDSSFEEVDENTNRVINNQDEFTQSITIPSPNITTDNKKINIQDNDSQNAEKVIKDEDIFLESITVK